MSPLSNSPQRTSRRLSSPPMSSPPNRPTRSNAVHRKSRGLCSLLRSRVYVRDYLRSSGYADDGQRQFSEVSCTRILFGNQLADEDEPDEITPVSKDSSFPPSENETMVILGDIPSCRHLSPTVFFPVFSVIVSCIALLDSRAFNDPYQHIVTTVHDLLLILGY